MITLRLFNTTDPARNQFVCRFKMCVNVLQTLYLPTSRGLMCKALIEFHKAGPFKGQVQMRV